jgi:hypothetical protein
MKRLPLIKYLYLSCANKLPEFNEIQINKRTDYRKRVAAAKAGKAAPGADTSTVSAAATDVDSPAVPKSKKQKPNGPDDSQMDVDGPTEEFQDASDAEDDPEQAQDDDEEDDDDDDDEEDEEGDDDEEEEGENEEEDTQDALEDKKANNDDDNDEALDDGAESD